MKVLKGEFIMKITYKKASESEANDAKRKIGLFRRNIFCGRKKAYKTIAISKMLDSFFMDSSAFPRKG